MKIEERLQVASRKEWRRWLAKHHKDRNEIWLVIYKGGRGTSHRPTVAYDAAVEEALCYGWIDVRTKHVDDKRYAIRFTPRRKESNWSESNRARVSKMLRKGKMTRAGLAVLPNEAIGLRENATRA